MGLSKRFWLVSVCSLSLLAVLFTPAIAAPTLQITGIVALADPGSCTPGPGFSLDITESSYGNVMDTNYFGDPRDNYVFVLYDGLGNALVADDQGAPYLGTYSGSTNIGDQFYSAPQARPFKIVAYDSTDFYGFPGGGWPALSVIESQPKLLEFIFDPAAVSGGTGCSSLPLVDIGGASGVFQAIHDGRINAYDQAAPVAVYQDEFGIKVYGIDPTTGRGVIALFVALDAGAAAPTDNSLLGEGENPFNTHSIDVWELTTGEFQLVTTYADGKPYVIIWHTGAEDMYHLVY